MRKHPLDYRKAEVARVMQCWRASESCSLVGVGSVGKSNLLHHLMNSEVQANYLPEEHAAHFVAINIDPNMLAPLPLDTEGEAIRVWAGYELMMHRLFMSMYPFDMLDPEEAKHFYATYQTLQDGTNPLYASMSIRYFELGLQFFFRRGYRLVFMFDEFEEMMHQLPVKFFQTLRGVRDQHKSQLSYLTFTRAPLDVVARRLGIDPLEFEPFKELFTDNVVYVGPYSDKDAHRMARELAARMELSLSPELLDFAVSVSGGFAGLLRTVLHELRQLADAGSFPESSFENNVTPWLSRLVGKAAVQSECRTLWDSLVGSEQNILLAVARSAPYSVDAETEAAVSMLLRKKLVRYRRDAQLLELEPALFRAFVVNYM